MSIANKKENDLKKNILENIYLSFKNFVPGGGGVMKSL